MNNNIARDSSLLLGMTGHWYRNKGSDRKCTVIPNEAERNEEPIRLAYDLTEDKLISNRKIKEFMNMIQDTHFLFYYA
jgi:hypothetical protein